MHCLPYPSQSGRLKTLHKACSGEVLFAWPDVQNRRNLYAITLPPPLGSLIDSDSLTAGETGLNSIPPENWPPVIIPFFAFRIMVGCGLVMLGLAWLGSYLSYKHRLAYNRPLLWVTFLSFPLPFIAIITGWFTAEVGRQPWVVYGALRTADAMTPFLTTREATISLAIFCAVYAFIFLFGTFYIYRLIRIGPARKPFRDTIRRIERAEAFVKGTAAHIRHSTGGAFYNPSRDFVSMPPLEAFRDAESYYAVLIHELTHNAESRIMPRRPAPQETRLDRRANAA